MGKIFSEKEISDFLKNNITKKKLRFLYKNNHVYKTVPVYENNKNKIIEKYQYDYIAEWLIKNNVEELFKKNINKIKRETTYKTPGHENITERRKKQLSEENLSEPLLAQKLYFENNYLNELGNIIDYETPIKNKRDEENKGIGKIDLLSYNKNEKLLTIIELKKKTNEETMLRAILEISTYYQLIYENKFIEDFKKTVKKPIKKAILIFKDSYLHKQYKGKIKELAKVLNVKVYTLQYKNNKYEACEEK